MVQEIQPKIRVIQKAVFETETAKQAIFDNVSVIEQRLMPSVPSGPSMNFYPDFYLNLILIFINIYPNKIESG